MYFSGSRHIFFLILVTLFFLDHSLQSPKIMYDAETGNSKGFGFISYDSFEAADLAIESMNGQYLCNRAINVMYAFKKVRWIRTVPSNLNSASSTLEIPFSAKTGSGERHNDFFFQKLLLFFFFFEYLFFFSV